MATHAKGRKAALRCCCCCCNFSQRPTRPEHNKAELGRTSHPTNPKKLFLTSLLWPDPRCTQTTIATNSYAATLTTASRTESPSSLSAVSRTLAFAPKVVPRAKWPRGTPQCDQDEGQVTPKSHPKTPPPPTWRTRIKMCHQPMLRWTLSNQINKT